MNNPFDHIEEYLAGELSSEDLQRFEKVLSTDASLRDEVEMVKELDLFAQRKADNQHALDVVKGVMEEGRREEEGRSSESGDELEGIEDGREESGGRDEESGDERQHEENGLKEEGKEKSWSFVKLVVGVAMVALLALLVWVVTTNYTEQLTSDQLYAEYFTVPEMAIIKKGETQDSILKIVQVLFNDKQYIRSLDEFEKLERSDDLDLYRAINFQLVNKPNESFKILNSLERKTNDTFWYLAMASLQLGNKENVKEWLGKIDESSVYYSRSVNLIKKL